MNISFVTMSQNSATKLLWLWTQVHATATELYLEGKSLSDVQVIQGAMQLLEKEIQPDIRPPEADPVYRKQLTKSLLYKVEYF